MIYERNNYRLTKEGDVRVIETPTFSRIKPLFEKLKPNWVFTQLNYAHYVNKIAKDLKINTCLFVRSQEHFCLDYKRFGECQKECLIDDSCASFKQHRAWTEKQIRLFNSCNLVVCNSRYTQGLVKQFFGINSLLVYPKVDNITYNPYKIRQGKYITLIKPTRAKGAHIFCRIAEMLPDHQFLAIGATNKAIYDWMRFLKNVTYLEGQKDLVPFLEQTSILLIPSLFEAFGRMAVEAMKLGIPVIASAQGGLFESVAGGGMLLKDYGDPRNWVNAITQIENNCAVFEKMSLQQSKIELKDDWDKFKEIITK